MKKSVKKVLQTGIKQIVDDQLKELTDIKDTSELNPYDQPNEFEAEEIIIDMEEKPVNTSPKQQVIKISHDSKPVYNSGYTVDWSTLPPVKITKQRYNNDGTVTELTYYDLSWETPLLESFLNNETLEQACNDINISIIEVHERLAESKRFKRRYYATLKAKRDKLLNFAEHMATKPNDPDRVMLIYLINRADRLMSEAQEKRTATLNVNVKEIANMPDDELAKLASGKRR